jgi:transcriptional regulator with XRE-family HTH domain
MELWEAQKKEDSKDQGQDLFPFDFDTEQPKEVPVKTDQEQNTEAVEPVEDEKSKPVEPAEIKKAPEPKIIPGNVAVQRRMLKKENVEVESLRGEAFSLGKYLQEVRVKTGLSLQQVEQETKIQKCYIESLEMENFKGLPPAVYVLAYARKLCTYYQVSPGKTDLIVEELRSHLEYSVPDDLFVKMNIDREVDEENEQKLRYLVWAFVGAVILFAGVVAIAVMMIISPSDEGKNSEVPANNVLAQFDGNKLNELIAPQQLDFKELPARNQ